MILNNPLIQRYRFSLLRPKQFWIYVSVYTGIILLMLFINFSILRLNSKSIYSISNDLYFQFISFQAILLVIWGAYNSGSAIKKEVSEKTYDFFRLLPMPAYQKAVGILIGKNLVVLLFAAINCIFIVIFLLAGYVNLIMQVQIILLLLTTTLLINFMSLLLSINPTAKRQDSKNTVGLLILIFFVVSGMINGLIALSGAEGVDNMPVHFYKIKVPVILLISFLEIYFSCWAFKGITRRFTHEGDALFTRKGAFVFLGIYEILALGLFYPYLNSRPDTVYTFWLITIIPVVLILLFSLKTMNKYIEYSRFINTSSSKSAGMVPSLLLYSNIACGFGLFIIWAVFAVGIFVAIDSSPSPTALFGIMVLLSFYLLFLLLIELYSVFQPIYGKISLLVGFIFILQVVLPFIISGITEEEKIAALSPIGYCVRIFANGYRMTELDIAICVFNLVLCSVPALLIRRRFNEIAIARGKM